MIKRVTFQKEWKAVTCRRCTNMHLRCTAVLGLVRAGFSFWVDSSTAKLGEMLRMRDEDESSRYAGVEVEVQKSGIKCLNFNAHVTDPAYVVEPSLTTPRITQPSFSSG
jgi:hypothetical protein